MPKRTIPVWGDRETKNRILDSATELFALNGFASISMNDIAKTVGIKAAAIYYHYECKEALLEEIISRFEIGFRHYLEWLSSENKKAESLEELMDNMFNEEFLYVLDPRGCLGTLLVLKEQHNNESARRCVFELLYDHSIKSLQSDFDRLIEKGIIPQSDTKTLATVFMFFVLAGNNMRICEYKGEEPPMDCVKTYTDVKKLFTAMLMQGN